MKSNVKKFELNVKDSSLSKLNFYFVPIFLIVPLVLNFSNPGLFVYSLLLFVLASIVVFLFQKNFNSNIIQWNNNIPKDNTMSIDIEANKICTPNWDIPMFSIREVFFEYAKQPHQKGLSKYLLNLYFVNAIVNLVTEDNTYKIPIQSKKEIKRLQNLFVRLNIKTTFDVELYNI